MITPEPIGDIWAERRPRLSFSVGVTGHRSERLAEIGTSLQALHAAVKSTLQRIHVAIERVAQENAHFLAPERPRIRLVSPLAEGADQLAASAALELGWDLDVCLPFAREEAVNDAADDASRRRCSEMISLADSVYELAGERGKDAAAYEAVGRVMLDQSDILIAIWDGQPARGRGGTAQVVAEAVAQNIPVVQIDPSDGAPSRLLWGALEAEGLEQLLLESVPTAAAEDALEQVVRTLTEPPRDERNRAMLYRFLAESHRRINPGISYPLLLAAAGAKRASASILRPTNPRACAEDLESSLLPLLEPRCQNLQDVHKVAARYGEADAAALYYAQRYRSGFVTNFALAAAAVVLALSGVIAPSLKLPFIMIEFLLVILIIANTRAGTASGWHEMWMDNRHLAERLRALSFASLLGDLVLRDRDDRDAGAVAAWVRWYSRATARQLGLLCVRADDAFLTAVRAAALNLIEKQISYQVSSRDLNGKMEHRMAIAGEWLFGSTGAACLVWIVANLLGVKVSIGPHITLTELVTVLTASLPALGGMLYGIRMQADFAGLSARSEATMKRLSRLARAIKADPLDHEKLASRLRRLTDITLVDVEKWHTASKSRPLSLPG